MEGGSTPSGGNAKPLSLAGALEAFVTAGFHGQTQRPVTAHNDPKNPPQYVMDTSLWLDSILEQGLVTSLDAWSHSLDVDAMLDDEIVNAMLGPMDDLERAVHLLQASPLRRKASIQPHVSCAVRAFSSRIARDQA